MTRNLILLPGAGGDPEFWRPLGERLPSEWTKTYLGWPGLGNQKPDPAVRSWHDLVGLLEPLLVGSPADLLAQSMGGVVALLVALRHPERVRRLVLVATSGGLDMAALGGIDWRPEYRREFPHAAAWIAERTPDLSDALSSVSQPTLLLWGDADPISPVAVGQRLHQALPHATLNLVPSGDHGLAREHAAVIAPLIVAHLNR